MKKILIIGAAGYVGKFVVERFCESQDFEIFALTRENGKFLLRDLNVSIVLKEELQNLNDFDIVLNLAYPSGVTPLKFSKINKEILNIIKNNVKPNGIIIHTSSLAIFGYPLDFPIVNKPIRKRFDIPYVMTKIEMENLLIKNFPNHQLHIVRLGNVWGPASPFWTFTLADKLTFGEPVLLKNKDGFSNITDVHNVADYIAFLSSKSFKKGVSFHHLAEFSRIKWLEIIRKLSEKLKKEIVYLDIELPIQKKILSEFKEIVFSFVRFPDKQSVLSTRFLSGFLWFVLSFLPQGLINLIKNLINPKNKLSVSTFIVDSNFFSLMSCEKQFISVVDEDWTPKVNFEESWQQIINWIEEVGY